MVSANAELRHRRDKIFYAEWCDGTLAVAVRVGLCDGIRYPDGSVQIKLRVPAPLLVRRLPCRVLLTMVARCHH